MRSVTSRPLTRLSPVLVQHAFRYPDDHDAHKKLKEIMMTYKTVSLHAVTRATQWGMQLPSAVPLRT